MLFVIDIGNTHVTAGVYSEEELLAHWRISSGVNRTTDEVWFMLKMLFQSENLQFEEVTGCAISSVVPDRTHTFVSMVEENFNISPILVNADSNSGLKILYDDPSSVGPDRICSSVAGFDEFGGPLIIVDFGTATTFDVVSKSAEYLGGVISPGLESSSFVLHQYAARLPKVELQFPKNIIGKTTEASMQAGIMFGFVEMVNGIIRRIIQELGYKATILATGGIAPQLLENLEKDVVFRPFLTLKGLQIIYKRNSS